MNQRQNDQNRNSGKSGKDNSRPPEKAPARDFRERGMVDKLTKKDARAILQSHAVQRAMYKARFESTVEGSSYNDSPEQWVRCNVEDPEPFSITLDRQREVLDAIEAADKGDPKVRELLVQLAGPNDSLTGYYPSVQKAAKKALEENIGEGASTNAPDHMSSKMDSKQALEVLSSYCDKQETVRRICRYLDDSPAWHEPLDSQEARLLFSEMAKKESSAPESQVLEAISAADLRNPKARNLLEVLSLGHSEIATAARKALDLHDGPTESATEAAGYLLQEYALELRMLCETGEGHIIYSRTEVLRAIRLVEKDKNDYVKNSIIEIFRFSEISNVREAARNWLSNNNVHEAFYS